MRDPQIANLPSKVAGIESSVAGLESSVAGLESSVAPLYRLRGQVLFSSSGTFTKASYPWLKAVRAIVVGGGGGGSYVAATGATQWSGTGSAGGGGVHIAWISADDLASSESVTVGAGGAAGDSNTLFGGNGGTSFFALVYGQGGNAGGYYSAQSPYVGVIFGGFGGQSWYSGVASSYVAERISSDGSLGRGESSFIYNNVDLLQAGGGGGTPPYGSDGDSSLSPNLATGTYGASYATASSTFGGGAPARLNSNSRSAVNGQAGISGCVHLFLYG